MVVWNLNDIYQPDAREALLEEFTSEISAFVDKRQTLSEKMSSKQFLDVLRQKERLGTLGQRLGAYAELWLSENTADATRTAHAAAISKRLAEADNATLFFGQWFRDLPDAAAAKFLNDRGPYRYYLQRLRDYRPHALKEREEQIVNLLTLSGAIAQERVYSIITNKYIFEWDGRKIGKEELMQHVRDAERAKRVRAYTLLLERYQQDEDVLTEIYRTIAGQWRNENMTLRNFTSPIQVRNHANDIPQLAIDALLSVTRKNIRLFAEYFHLKSKICSIQIDRYDLYAPLQEDTQHYSYENSKKITLDTYREFDVGMHDLAVKIFDQNHVHSDLLPGKRSGAFCYTINTNITPYILLNHVGKLTDVFTMVHEFGHGIHGLSAAGQTQFTFHAALPLAETASIFGEMLLAKKMLAKASPEAKKEMLMRALERQYASIVRQAYFVLFETEAHEAIEKGATANDLNAIYLKLLREQLEPGVKVPEIFAREWAYIPHLFYSPFYCYAYAFGNLLVLALYRMYEEQGTAFVPRYKKILAAGASAPPAEILQNIGVDITSPAFWQQGFDIIKEELEELKRLM